MVELLQKLCQERGTNFYQLEILLKLGSGTIRRWDKSLPSVEKLSRVAEYFGVSMDYLMTGKQPIGNDGLSESETRLLAAFRALEPEQQGSVLQLLQSIAAQRQAAPDLHE